MRRVPTCLPVALAILIGAPLGACHRTPPKDGGATVQPAATPPVPMPADDAGKYGTAEAATQPDHPVETPTVAAVEKPGGVPMSDAAKMAMVPPDPNAKAKAAASVPN